MKTFNKMVQFGPQYGIQAELSWNWWGFSLGGSVFRNLGCTMAGFTVNFFWLNLIVFRERYEPYTRYQTFSPNTPFSLEAA